MIFSDLTLARRLEKRGGACVAPSLLRRADVCLRNCGSDMDQGAPAPRWSSTAFDARLRKSFGLGLFRTAGGGRFALKWKEFFQEPRRSSDA